MHETVYETHKPKIDGLDLDVRSLKEDVRYNRGHLENIEKNLPTMIREIIELYIEQRVRPKMDEFATKAELTEKLQPKMDYDLFRAYQREEIN